MHMSTISKTSKYCCTCQHFGGKAILKGSIVEYENEKLRTISSAISGRNFGNKQEAKCNQGSRKYAQQILGKRSHNGVKLSYAILRST